MLIVILNILLFTIIYVKCGLSTGLVSDSLYSKSTSHFIKQTSVKNRTDVTFPISIKVCGASQTRSVYLRQGSNRKERLDKRNITFFFTPSSKK